MSRCGSPPLHAIGGTMPDPEPLRVMIAEDEPLARDLLVDMLAEHQAVEVVAVCENGRDALEALASEGPDLLLLDIQMPELDGFEVLHALPPDRTPAVVFVTAFDSYAIRAFEVEALDYLLKPFDEERLARTLERARARLGGSEREGLREELERAFGRLQTPPAFLRRIAVPDGEGIRLLDLYEVAWIEAAGKYVRVHVPEGSHLVREGIGTLESRLDPQRFARVSRSAIVNLDRVEEIQKWFHGQYLLLLACGAKIPTTRTYRTHLDEVLSNRP